MGTNNRGVEMTFESDGAYAEYLQANELIKDGGFKRHDNGILKSDVTVLQQLAENARYSPEADPVKHDDRFWTALLGDLEHLEWVVNLYRDALEQEGVACACEHPEIDIPLENRPILYPDRDEWQLQTALAGVIAKSERLRQRVKGKMQKEGMVAR